MVNWNGRKFKPQLYFGGKLALVRSLPKLTNPVDITLIFSTILFHWKSLKAEGIISPGVLLSRGCVCVCVYNNMNFLFHQSRVSSDYPRLQKNRRAAPSLRGPIRSQKELCLFLDEPQRKIKYQQEQARLIDVYK